MGLFANATETAKRIDENKGAPEGFKDLIKIDVKNLKDIITINKAVVQIKQKILKDKDGKPIKDESGSFVPLEDFKGRPVLGAVLFVAFDNDKYFITTSRPMINQFKVIDPTINFNEIGLYEVNGIKDSKVKVVMTDYELANKNIYPYPVLIDVED